MYDILAGALVLAQLSGGPATRPNPRTSFEAVSKKAADARDAGNLDEAAALYSKAVTARPSWDEGWWNLGSIAYDRDKYSDCDRAFKKLTALKPDLSPAWIMSGLCQYALHDYAASRASLLQAERLKFDAPPELANAGRLHLALVLTKAGAFEKAIVLLTELIRMDHKTPEASVAAGIAGLRKNWIPSEVPEASREIVAKLGDAMASAMEMDPKGAIQKFTALVEEYPSEPDIHYRFGAFLMQQEPEHGIAEIRRALELDPGHIPALVGIATIYLKNGDAAGSLKYAEQAVTTEPNDFAPHVAMGRALLNLDNAAGAAEQLEMATKLAPESADAHFSLASAYARLGRKDDAQRQQDEFRRLRNTIDSAHR